MSDRISAVDDLGGLRERGAGSGERAARAAASGRPDSLGDVTQDNPFGQVLVALVTPMTADGEVDWPGVEKHIADVIAAGE